MKTMMSYYASYELSLLAKQAGFDEECEKFYSNEILKTYYPARNNSSCIELGFLKTITAPELTHLQQWVWEKFKVWVSSFQETQSKKSQIDGIVTFGYSIKKNGADTSFNNTSFDCPYKALQEGLIEFLKKNF